MGKIKEIFIFVFAILASCSSTCYAQQWAIAYGGTGNETFESIHQTPNGEYTVVFDTNSFDNGSFIVLKLNTDGTISWQKIYDVGKIYGVTTVELTSDGEYIIGIIAPGERGLLLKLNADGDVIWYKELFDCWITCNLHSVKQTSDGGLMIFTSSYGYLGGGVSLTKYDADGNAIWNSRYQFSGGFTNSYCIEPTNDGGCVLTIRTDGYPTPFIFKLDADGNIVWQKTYDHSLSLSHPIRQTQDGGYVAIGEGNWVTKLDTDGDVVWAKEYTGEPRSIRETSDGGYTLLLDKSGKSVLLKLNQSGNIIWQKSYEGGGLNSVLETSDGGYILGGSTNSFGVGSDDVWVLKVNQNGDIPQCDIVGESDVTSTDISITSNNTNFEAPSSPAEGSLSDLPDVPISSEASNAEATIVCFHTTPLPDIKVNNSDGPITLDQNDTLTITVSLNNNGITDNADWWLAAQTPFGLYFYTFYGWRPYPVPVHQGPLFYLDSYEVFSRPVSGLQEGTYTLYFGVDTDMDEDITWDSAYYDLTLVTIESGTTEEARIGSLD